MACKMWIAFAKIGKQEKSQDKLCIAIHMPYNEKTVYSKCVLLHLDENSVGKIVITFNYAVR